MRSGHVYPALVQTLEDWRSRSPDVLTASVGAPPEVAELRLGGELVRIESSSTWADAKQVAVLVEAIAYGPANWTTERVAERACIRVQPGKAAR